MLRALQRTFGWNVITIHFLVEGKTIAILTAAKIKNKIFSLPHADSLGFTTLTPSLTPSIPPSLIPSIPQSLFPSLTPSLTQSPTPSLPPSPTPPIPPSPTPPLPPSPTPPISPSLPLSISLLSHTALYTGIDKETGHRSVELTDEALIASIKSTPPIKDIHIRSTIPLLEYRTGHKVISSLSLAGGYEKVIAGLNPNVRRKINKAKKNGITVKAGNNELVNDFYKVYRKNIHKHGSFGLPRVFFRDLSPDDSRLFVAYHNNQPIGSALLTWMMDSSRNIAMEMSENIAFSTLPKFNHLYTGYALHDAMIKASVNLGCSTYSMGRSTPGSPVHNYKKQWGTTDQVLYYNSLLPLSGGLSRFNFIRPVLKKLPQWVMEPLDYFVAKRIY